MKPDIKTKETKHFDPDASAQIYLNKLQEFSEAVLAREGLGTEVELSRTLHFIKEILHADCVLLGEILSTDESGMLLGIADDKEFKTNIEGMHAGILANMASDVSIITSGDDDGSREAVTILLDGFLVLSGISVPIRSEQGTRGILAVYYHKSIPISDSRTLFLKSMANVVSHLLQSQELLSKVSLKNAKHVVDAKREWEGTVDALRQLVIVLNEDAQIIRANKTIQFWDMGSVDSQVGKHIETIISTLTDNKITDTYPGWDQIWSNLQEYQHIEWESENLQKTKVLRFSLRTINKDHEAKNKKTHQGYAVLFVEDITQSKIAENKLRKYTSQLENKIQKGHKQLEQVNEKLNLELIQHRKSKAALIRSEERFYRLFQGSLSGICQLDIGRVRFYNDRFADVFKYPREQLNNMPLINLFVAEDRGALMSLFADLEDSKESRRHVVARANDATGRALWLEVGFDWVTFENNKKVIVNVIDVTRQKNIEISLRESEGRLQNLSAQLINAQEMERKRLSLELHDELGQSLSAIKYSLEDFKKSAACSTNSDCESVIGKVVENIRGTINETRRMAMDLRPSILDDLGIISTISWFCRQYQQTYQHIQIETKIEVDEDDINDSRKIAIYRILQEALNNTAKYSGADTVSIILQRIEDDYIEMIIADNGCGIPEGRRMMAQTDSLGLSGMQERVEFTGGTFMLSDNSPSGVMIDIHWPGSISIESSL